MPRPWHFKSFSFNLFTHSKKEGREEREEGGSDGRTVGFLKFFVLIDLNHQDFNFFLIFVKKCISNSRRVLIYIIYVEKVLLINVKVTPPNPHLPAFPPKAAWG